MQYILKGKRHIFAWVLEFEHIRTTEAEEDEEPEEEEHLTQDPHGTVYSPVVEKDHCPPEGVGTGEWGSKIASVQAEHKFGFGISHGEEV
jgi:hypothetical protein